MGISKKLLPFFTLFLYIPCPQWPEWEYVFLYRLYKKGTIVCKWTDHPYCICAFLSESFAISKVYHYVVDPIPLLSCWAAHRRFLSAIQCSLTKTFICWPPSLISIVLRFWKRLFTFQSPMCVIVVHLSLLLWIWRLMICFLKLKTYISRNNPF